MEWTDFLPQTTRNDGAEAVVDLSDGSRLLGLYIHGVEEYPMLWVKIDPFKRPVSMARQDAEFFVDTAVPVQSNPRRHADREDA